MFEGRLPLWLEGHDDEANKDVDHEESNDDDVDEIKEGHIGSVIVNRAVVDLVGVDGDVENPEEKGMMHVVKWSATVRLASMCMYIFGVCVFLHIFMHFYMLLYIFCDNFFVCDLPFPTLWSNINLNNSSYSTS